jgi:hypothetical protein
MVYHLKYCLLLPLLFYLFAVCSIRLFLIDIFHFSLVIFLIASLGVMGDQGRNGHFGAYLDWAWWTGLAGLFIITITFIILVAEVVDMLLFSSPINRPPKMSK